MNQDQRSLMAMAVAIRAELSRRNVQDATTASLPVQAWNDLVQVTRRLERARDRGWQLAAGSLAADQLEAATYVQERINAWIEQRRHRSVRGFLPEAAELYRDLVGLEGEFGAVHCDWDKKELFVTTRSIELEGVRLGRFDIRLDWAPVDEYSTPYRIVALDPNPAAKNDLVTHPHVEDENLCPGAGRSAIDKALQDGRIYDFFLIVSQILQTYTRGSAFVELDDWDTVGLHCRDCDCEVDEESRYRCEECDGTLCSECLTTCSGCGYDYCAACLSTCAGCHERFCSTCLCKCERCQAAVCSDCRQTETLCKNCHESEQANAGEPESVDHEIRPSRTGVAI